MLSIVLCKLVGGIKFMAMPTTCVIKMINTMSLKPTIYN